MRSVQPLSFVYRSVRRCSPPIYTSGRQPALNIPFDETVCNNLPTWVAPSNQCMNRCRNRQQTWLVAKANCAFRRLYKRVWEHRHPRSSTTFNFYMAFVLSTLLFWLQKVRYVPKSPKDPLTIIIAQCQLS